MAEQKFRQEKRRRPVLRVGLHIIWNAGMKMGVALRLDEPGKRKMFRFRAFSAQIGLYSRAGCGTPVEKKQPLGTPMTLISICTIV
jgi:hypothetical protein